MKTMDDGEALALDCCACSNLQRSKVRCAYSATICATARGIGQISITRNAYQQTAD